MAGVTKHWTLTLNGEECKKLKRLLHRCLLDIQSDKCYRVAVRDDPEYGRLVRDGVDITDSVYREEQDARMFLRRLP